MKNQSIAVAPTPDATPTSAKLVGIATQAFVYGFPLVVVDLTKEQFTNYEKAESAGAPINQFSNKQVFPTPANTTVVRPNCDTFYSIAFLDLSNGPVVMSIPATGDQYYMMPLLDGFTNVISGSPGTRTGETDGGDYLIVGPTSPIPQGIDTSDFTIIPSGTDMVWALGRFQVDNPDLSDMSINGGGYVANLQDQLAITPLSAWGTVYTYPAGQTHPPQTADPNDIIANMSITAFFTRLNQLLLTNPPTTDDQPAMEQFAKIGVGVNPVIPFAERRFEAHTMTAMDKIPELGIEGFIKLGNKPSSGTTGWSVQLNPIMGAYGTDYQTRGVIACIGLGANLVEDAVYYNTAQAGSVATDYLDCSDGQKYTLTLNPTPPVSAFWSLTMYNEKGALVENDIYRYVLGHSDAYPIVPDANGNVTIYIQNEAISSNDPRFNYWLPAPASKFTLLLRAYDPTGGLTGPILSNTWTAPAVVKA